MRVVSDSFISLDEIRAIPKEHYPIIMYCDGGSLFGWLIRKVDKSAASHLQILFDSDKIATQWFWYKIVDVDHLKSYNTKMIWNPEWTPEQRKAMIDLILQRLASPWWKTKYDVWGVIGKALGFEWMQSKEKDFCSEAVGRIIRLVDFEFDAWMGVNDNPTPKEINQYTKSHHPPYEVYGRYMVDD